MIIDRRVDKVIKTGERTIPFYATIENIGRALKGMRQNGSNLENYKVFQYKLVFNEVIVE